MVMRPPLWNEHHYAVEQEHLRHNDAVLRYGEPTAFVLWWHLDDHKAGQVARCSFCYLSRGEIAEAYGQGAQAGCPNCYGTTFEGGYRAIIYRPCLWDVTETSSDLRRRGVTTIKTARIDTLSTFTMRDGDTLVRLDGTRWRIGQPGMNEITTGFGFQGGLRSHIRSTAAASLMDPSSPGAKLDIDLDPLTDTGWNPSVLMYEDHPHDDINGVLNTDYEAQ